MSRMSKKVPEPVPAESPRGLKTFVIGAAFRSVVPGADRQTLGVEDLFSFDLVTHTVRDTNASDAMRAFLAHTDARLINGWEDSEQRQRLLFIIPVERVMFSRPTAANIEVSTTHRHDNGAPIRYLRG